MREISSASIRGEAELFRRMNSISLGRSKRIRTIKVRGIHLLMIFVLVALTGFAAFRLGHFFLTWDRLEVKSFKLVNPPQTDRNVLQGILGEYKGNILSFEVDRLQSTLQKMPQVRDVAVYRRLPDVVEIRFSLKKPVLQFQIGARIWYYDEEGTRLYEAGAFQEDLITCRNLGEKDMGRIGKLIGELAPLRKSIEYLSYRKPYGVVIKLKGVNEVFYPGERDFVKKISQYMKIRSMDALSPYRIKVVDLRFSDRIYIEHESEEVTAP